MSEIDQASGVPTRIPLSIVLERRRVTRGPWTTWQWEAVAAVAGEQVAEHSPEATLVHRDANSERWLWGGFRIELHRDGCEGYWYNLLSDRPYLFVVCFGVEEPGDGPDLDPAFVTANQDEATGHMESDDPVFSVPMPDQVHQWIERYVIAHYVPERKRKRERRDWFEEAEDAQARARSSRSD